MCPTNVVSLQTFSWVALLFEHSPDIFDSKTKISNTTFPIPLDKDIFTLYVTVCYGRLPFSAVDLSVKVGDTAGSGQ